MKEMERILAYRTLLVFAVYLVEMRETTVFFPKTMLYKNYYLFGVLIYKQLKEIKLL